MFLSRTVAAEICMECRSNVPAYVALKKLEASGELLFRLKDLVNDLLKVSYVNRAISAEADSNVLAFPTDSFNHSSSYHTDSPAIVPGLRINISFFDSTTRHANNRILHRTHHRHIPRGYIRKTVIFLTRNLQEQVRTSWYYVCQEEGSSGCIG